MRATLAKPIFLTSGFSLGTSYCRGSKHERFVTEVNASSLSYSKNRRRNELSKWQTFSVRAVGHKYHGVVLLNVESTFEVAS